MIHTHSLGRAARYHAGATALVSGAARPTFQQLHSRVAGIAAALTQHGFAVGDRLALHLPNETEYLELIYACAWLGVTAVPLNTRFSVQLSARTATRKRRIRKRVVRRIDPRRRCVQKHADSCSARVLKLEPLIILTRRLQPQRSHNGRHHEALQPEETALSK